MVKRIVVFFIVFALVFSALAASAANAQRRVAQLAAGGRLPSPTVSPETVDLGELRPGGESKGTFFTRKTDSVNPEWFAEAPEGWLPGEENSLSGLVGEAPAPLSVSLRFLKAVSRADKKYASLQLRMETGGRFAVFSRDVPLGELRESLQFNYIGGTQTVFVEARLAELSPTPTLELDSYFVDFGKKRAGENVSRRIHLTNKGKNPLKWKVSAAGAGEAPPEGRYVSFLRVLADLPAVLTGLLMEGMELSGNWGKNDGYPTGQGEQSSLQYSFNGVGISLSLWKSAEGNVISAFIDGQFVDVVDGYSENRERAEVLIADNLLDGPHLLTIQCGDGPVTFEGVRIFGRPVMKGPRGWVNVFPDSGMTTRETDYVNISFTTRGLQPGIYGERLLFSSNGGDAEVQLFIEIAGDTQARLVDVHRYLAGSGCLLTSTPQAETGRIQARKYSYSGLVFRLFPPNTPGTTELYRWFNAASGDHFYSYEPNGAKHLSGYAFDGTIGNIGTSKLTGTRELYRWVNRKTKHHFYTTDKSGEGLSKKGFQFDGIAGFVK
jgi:hypothetical protein